MIPKVPRDGPLPLSIDQDSLLMAEGFARLRRVPVPLFHGWLGLVLDQAVDVDRLERALNTAVSHHEVLRTGFDDPSAMSAAALGTALASLRRAGIQSSIFRQHVHDDVRLPVTVREVEPVLPSRPGSLDPILQATIADHINQPFSYATPPLLRAALLRGANQIVLSLAVHHLIADRVSWAVLHADLERAYAVGATAESIGGTASTVQFADYASWQRVEIARGRRDGMLAYWRRRWTCDLPCLVTLRDLPFGRAGTSTTSLRSAVASVDLDSRRRDQTRVFLRANNATAYMLGLTVTLVLLHRYTGASRVAVASSLSNRTQPETARLFGWLAGVYVIGADVHDDMTLVDLLGRVRSGVIGALENQALPFGFLWTRLVAEEHLVREMVPPDWIAFEYVRSPTTTFADGITRGTLDLLDVSGSQNRMELMLTMLDQPGDLRLCCRYPAERYDASDIDTALREWRQILSALLDRPHLTVGELIRVEASA